VARASIRGMRKSPVGSRVWPLRASERSFGNLNEDKHIRSKFHDAAAAAAGDLRHLTQSMVTSLSAGDLGRDRTQPGRGPGAGSGGGRGGRRRKRHTRLRIQRSSPRTPPQER